MIGAREHHWRNALLRLGFSGLICLLWVMAHIVPIDSILYGNPLNRRQFNYSGRRIKCMGFHGLSTLRSEKVLFLIILLFSLFAVLSHLLDKI
jgi:hypothetical protein